MPLASDSPPLKREACLAWLGQTIRNPKVPIETRLDALRVHSAIWGLKLSERDQWGVFSALMNGAGEVPASSMWK